MQDFACANIAVQVFELIEKRASEEHRRPADTGKTGGNDLIRVTCPPAYEFGKVGRGYERLVRQRDEYRVTLVAAGTYPTGDAAAYPACKVFVDNDGISESPCGTADLIGVMADNQADIAGTGTLCR